MLPLLDQLLSDAGWSRNSLDRLAVGIGPGTFTGLRVGVALIQGIALGLGRPLYGVSSLQAMARAVPATVPALRCALLDARRDEVFVAAYDAFGAEQVGPRAVPRKNVLQWLADHLPADTVYVGEEAARLLPDARVHRAADADLPHAINTGRIAAERAVHEFAAEPLYIRDVDAVLPVLPPSPLS